MNMAMFVIGVVFLLGGFSIPFSSAYQYGLHVPMSNNRLVWAWGLFLLGMALMVAASFGA